CLRRQTRMRRGTTRARNCDPRSSVLRLTGRPYAGLRRKGRESALGLRHGTGFQNRERDRGAWWLDQLCRPSDCRGNGPFPIGIFDQYGHAWQYLAGLLRRWEVALPACGRGFRGPAVPAIIRMMLSDCDAEPRFQLALARVLAALPGVSAAVSGQS